MPLDLYLDLRHRVTLSALWLICLLNILFRDIHEFLRPGYIEEVMSGVIGGVPLDQTMILVSAFVLQVPLMMIMANLVLSSRAQRLANLIAAPLIMGSIAAFPPGDADDHVFAAIEILLLFAVVILSWRGQVETRHSAAI